MAISVNGPTFSSASQATRNTVSTGFERISSGKQINSAIDGAAELSIASRISAQVKGLDIASRNAGDAISLTQVADGALGSINDNLLRIRELTLQSANGTLTDQDRQGLAAEADQLKEENRNILEKTSFNGVSIFNNDSNLNFQVGPNTGDQLTVEGQNLQQQLSSSGLDDIDLSTQQGATDALAVIDQATSDINARASEFGATANRIESTVNELQSSKINASAAQSRVEDADLAKELTKISAGLIQEQAQIAVQAQANASRGFALQLLK